MQDILLIGKRFTATAKLSSCRVFIFRNIWHSPKERKTKLSNKNLHKNPKVNTEHECLIACHVSTPLVVGLLGHIKPISLKNTSQIFNSIWFKVKKNTVIGFLTSKSRVVHLRTTPSFENPSF